MNRSSLTKHITCHTFRRTFATHGIQSNMSIEEISKLLGHENIATTMIYAQVQKEKTKYDYERSII